MSEHDDIDRIANQVIDESGRFALASFNLLTLARGAILRGEEVARLADELGRVKSERDRLRRLVP